MEDEGETGSPLTVFRVAERLYALPLEQVSEAVLMAALTPVPEAAPWHAGVLDLRGRAIPVIDMRRRLGHPAREPGLETPILIAECSAGTAGLIVDSVAELVHARLEDPLDPVDGGDGVVSATAHIGEQLMLVLDLERVLAGLNREEGDPA